MATSIGEWTDLEPATKDTADICDEVKSDLESKTNRQFPEYFAYAYKVNQRIGGATYIIKVYVGQGECVFLTIGNMLTQAGNSYSLESFETGKKQYDPIQV